jgi:hypothetical protein
MIYYTYINHALSPKAGTGKFYFIIPPKQPHFIKITWLDLESFF